MHTQYNKLELNTLDNDIEPDSECEKDSTLNKNIKYFLSELSFSCCINLSCEFITYHKANLHEPLSQNELLRDKPEVIN